VLSYIPFSFFGCPNSLGTKGYVVVVVVAGTIQYYKNSYIGFWEVIGRVGSDFHISFASGFSLNCHLHSLFLVECWRLWLYVPDFCSLFPTDIDMFPPNCISDFAFPTEHSRFLSRSQTKRRKRKWLGTFPDCFHVQWFCICDLLLSMAWWHICFLFNTHDRTWKVTMTSSALYPGSTAGLQGGMPMSYAAAVKSWLCWSCVWVCLVCGGWRLGGVLGYLSMLMLWRKSANCRD